MFKSILVVALLCVGCSATFTSPPDMECERACINQHGNCFPNSQKWECREYDSCSYRCQRPDWAAIQDMHDRHDRRH
jgi:hypothetical protein